MRALFWCMALCLLQKAGTAFAGAFDGFLVLPGADEFGVSAEEDVRDLPAVELGRARVDGRGDKAVLKGVGQGRCLVGEHTGDEADDAVGQECRRDFAAAYHEVSHGDLAGDEVFADALVDALVVAAQNDDVLLEGELVGYALGEDFSGETAVVAGELYRHQGEWKFTAIGQGYDGGLAALCNSYGLAT